MSDGYLQEIEAVWRSNNDWDYEQEPPTWEFHGLRCPTDRCTGALKIEDVKFERHRSIYEWNRRIIDQAEWDMWIKIRFSCYLCLCRGDYEAPTYPPQKRKNVTEVHAVPNKAWTGWYKLGINWDDENNDDWKPNLDRLSDDL